MTPPFIIEKDRARLRFNEPYGKGCLSIDFDGSGGLCIFLDPHEMMELAGTLINAARRMRRG